MCPAPPSHRTADAPRVLYFAYGSNLDREQMVRRCASAEPRFLARLEHHRLDFTHPSRRWNGGAADVLPCPASSVWGGVYALAVADLDALDAFEGGYERVALEVRDPANALHRVVSYHVRVKQATPPHALYLDTLLRWGAHWGFPEDYLEALRGVAAAR